MPRRIKCQIVIPGPKNAKGIRGQGTMVGKEKRWLAGPAEGAWWFKYAPILALIVIAILAIGWGSSCNSTPAPQPPAMIGTAPATQQPQPPAVVGAPTVVCCSPSSPANNTIIMGQQSIAPPSGVLAPTGIVSMGGDRTIIIIPERQ